MKITYYANGQIASFEGTPRDFVDAGMIQWSATIKRVERNQDKQTEKLYTRQQIDGWKWKPLW